jgi:hypothetical protein
VRKLAISPTIAFGKPARSFHAHPKFLHTGYGTPASWPYLQGHMSVSSRLLAQRLDPDLKWRLKVPFSNAGNLISGSTFVG